MKAVQEVTIPLRRFTDLIDGCDLNERQRRWCYGFIAHEIGYGGTTAVARALSVSPLTVKVGLKEVAKSIESDGDSNNSPTEIPTGRIRRPGGGRKRATDTQPGLTVALKELLESSTVGDPMRVILWTTLSLRKIEDYLEEKGFKASHSLIGRLLEELGYSKQVNQKMVQIGSPHPDREAQFRFINQKSKEFLSEGVPVISVDCKKKENLGNFKNNGAEYRPTGDPRKTFDHDWLIKRLGKVAPYGIYVLNSNTGFVNLGQSCDTAEFAGESVARWWHYFGEPNFKGTKKLYITCDGGGSNGCRVRLWKYVLATIAESYGIEIHVSHLPPGTSKWNKVEHRLFCYITKNWAGQPLVDVETVINLIRNTTTKNGLKVECQKDNNVYFRGASISDEEFDSIQLEPEGEFPLWNYVIRGFRTEEK